MRRLLVIFAIALLPTLAMARGGGGGGGHGGMGGGHGGMSGGHMGGWGGGHMAAAWSGHGSTSIAGSTRMAVWTGHMAAWNGHAGNRFNHGRFNHGHFVHRHGRVFFVGGPWWWGGYGYSDYGCWQWVPTRWGPRRIWVCGDY